MAAPLQRLEIWHNAKHVSTAEFKKADSHVTANVPLNERTWPGGVVKAIQVHFWPDSPHYVVLEITTEE